MAETASGLSLFEVNTDENKDLSCTCPAFGIKSSCKHTRLVSRRIKENKGVYPFFWSEKINHDEVTKALNSEQDFRDLVIKYGKVEVY